MLIKDKVRASNDIISAWKELWWKEEFYKQIESWENFWRAFLRSAKSLVKWNVNNILIWLAEKYYVWESSGVRWFQKIVSRTLLSKNDWTIKELLIALWEDTSNKVNQVLLQVDKNRMDLAVHNTKTRNSQLTNIVILSAWEECWWREKFEELLNEWLSFWESFLRSAKEFNFKPNTIISTTASNFSSVFQSQRTNFLLLICRKLWLHTTNIEDVLMVLYKKDRKKVDVLLKIIEQNKKRSQKIKVTT